MSRLKHRQKQRDRRRRMAHEMTAAERRVSSELSYGKSPQEIADDWNLSIHYVDKIIERLRALKESKNNDHQR